MVRCYLWDYVQQFTRLLGHGLSDNFPENGLILFKKLLEKYGYWVVSFTEVPVMPLALAMGI